MLTQGEVRRPAPTCLWWERVRRCRWRKRSQSVQRLPQMLHRMMAAVSPSSWLSHMGCGQKGRESMCYSFDYLSIIFTRCSSFYIILTICFCCPSLPIHRPEDNLSTWSWSSTHSEAKASHSYETERDIWLINTHTFVNQMHALHMMICESIPLWWRYSAQETDAPPPFWSGLWWSQLLHFWWLWTKHPKGGPENSKWCLRGTFPSAIQHMIKVTNVVPYQIMALQRVKRKDLNNRNLQPPCL